MWEHVETTFNSKVQVLVNNAGLNPSAGWKPCIDVMLYGTMIGTFLARKKMGTSQVQTIRNEIVKHVSSILIFQLQLNSKDYCFISRAEKEAELSM